jgi:thymidylate synthase (FAD)
MKFVTPQTIHLAGMAVENTADFLAALGAPENWDTDAPSDAEKLIELAGRLCYKSFGTDLNPNVTRVREGNASYMAGILTSKHGSVLEHAHDTFAFINVSRVFTHELVRHRPNNFSQESLRFVRLDKLKMFYPSVFKRDFLLDVYDALDGDAKDKIGQQHTYYRITNPDLIREKWADTTAAVLLQTFIETAERLEETQLALARLLQLDHITNFGVKKKLTSAMRRLAPEGLGTDIICTGNHRAWRHQIEVRTSAHAEEEIRIVFADVYNQLSGRYPNVYQDARVETIDGLPQITFENSRV